MTADDREDRETGQPAADPDARPDVGSAGRHTVKGRDWFVLGLVAGLAIALGVYLLARTVDGGSDTASPAATSTVTVTESPPNDPGPDDVVGTVVQPPGVPTGTTSRTTAGSTAGGATGATGSTGATESTGADTDGGAGGTAMEQDPIGPLGDQARRVPDDPLARGEVDAPVVMVMFSDYRCPFCAKFSRDLEPQLVDKYVETGRMRIEWRDFPIFGPESELAAVAGRAAARQDRFWEFNKAVYAAAPQSGHPDYDRSDLISFAKKAGVPDIAAFTADLDDPKLAAAVDADFDEGSSLGVPATPSFIINGYPIRGAQPIEQFYEVIDTVESLQ